jgi:adenylate cyclase
MNRGAFDFLVKPIDFTDLEATITKTLRHLDVLREARRRQAAAERAHAALSRYFSPTLAERLAGATDGVELAGQWRDIAAMFTDITSFTTLVETIAPSVLGELLNDYLAGMTSIVFAHEGTVAKIVGDALYVLFGAPGDQPDHAARAVACALALDAFSEGLRATWRERGVALGVTRIGVNAGAAIVGNFGRGSFFDYTAYGDTINIAARLEAANKQLGTRICVSESASSKVPGFCGRPVGDLMLRGRTEPLRAFEPISPRQGDDASRDPYLQAFAKLEAGDAGAIGAFAAEVGRRPDDQLASFHLKRLLNGAKGARVQMD